MAKLIGSEAHTNESATARLRQLAAVHQPEYDVPGEKTYFSGQYNVWVTARREGRVLIFSLFEGCPCGG